MHAFRKLQSIYVLSYFPFGFERRIWDLIILVPDHCLSFYFSRDDAQLSITFVLFSCFLSLLIIAAVLYKIKHKYDGYRRRQRMIVEMEEMASRPSAVIALEIERKYDNCMADKKDNKLELRKRKRVNISNFQF